MVLFGQTKNQQSVIGEETEMSEVKFFETPLTRFAGTIADITGEGRGDKDFGVGTDGKTYRRQSGDI